MLNTHKLLYILPDVAYIAELLPGKKDHSFIIQAFRQINGEFLNEEEELIAENIEKLFSKIEPETYHLVLPDFLFTNTIIEVKETNENKVKQYIKEDLLPKLELTKESHEIETFSLTQYNGATKVQLTALERGILDPLVVSAQNHQITIEHISPLTWTIKSVISLEPSISVLQIGTLLYVAEHYIGVDQCTMSRVDELENVVDTIKTLKGAQPSIQTVYLLTNNLVEEKLKEQVSSTLPIQQLAIFKEEDSQMPSYVKQIIESGMKTLDIPDFPVPSFVLPKHPLGKVAVAPVPSEVKAAEPVAETKPVPPPEPKVETPVVAPLVPAAPVSAKADFDTDDIEDDDEKDEDLPATKDKDNADDEAELPRPTSPAPSLAAPAIAAAAAIIPAEVPQVMAAIAPAAPVTPPVVTPPVVETPKVTAPIMTTSSISSEHESITEETKPPARPALVETPSKVENLTDTIPSSKSSVMEDDSTIARLAGHPPMTPETLDSDSYQSETALIPAKRPVIKNQGGGGSLMRMAFVSLVVFILTVAIGIGIGYSILSLNNRNQTADVPSPVASTAPAIVVASPSPTAVASTSATASGSGTVTKKSTKVLIVNATTTPGYATTTSKKLQAAGYGTVKAQNAKGTYDPGFYALMTKQDSALLKTLSTDSELSLTFAAGKATEDPSNQYDVVIVLGK